MPKFPKEIFATWDEPEEEEPCLIAWEGSEDAEDGQKVAVYELKTVHTKVITHSLK